MRKTYIASLCLLSMSSLYAGADAALHTDWLDKQNNPSQDFFSYANGNWIKQNPIPPEYASWGSFSVLQKKMHEIIHELLKEAANDKEAKPGSITQKVGDFYYSGMNEQAIEQQGITPLKFEFDMIEAIKNQQDLQKVIAHLQLIGVNALFSFSSMQDFKDSKQMIAAAMQGGLGLPDRDYYLKEDIKFKAIRDAYVDHIAKMLILLGDETTAAASKAKRIMEIETMLAKASMSQIDQRDPHAVYHIMDRKALDHLMPNFSWEKYFSTVGLDKLKNINLAMPDFFKVLNTQLTAISLEDWKTYLRWHLIDTFAPYLSKQFVDQNFNMVSKLNGSKKLLPRWRRVVHAEDAALGFAVGKLYVEKYFSKQEKQQVIVMMDNIREALSKVLKTRTWMEEETRKAALKKLSLMEGRIGYPDKWRDYASLSIDKNSYVLNVLHANKFLTKRDLDKIGKPIDRTEWVMTPQTVNAYYDPSMNNLNIPAGILQPPFYDPKAPAAINYGGIGFVIGHEMTHGFDDQGAKFDGEGNLKNWWTSMDLKKFKLATQCIVDQFSKYKVDDNFPVQGKLVVGEATADLGGLILAYNALLDSKGFEKAQTIEGFTPKQQFFLSMAHTWAGSVRPEQQRNYVTTDPHPPYKYRVNGTLVNMEAFREAFSIKEGASMISKNRCIIW